VSLLRNGDPFPKLEVRTVGGGTIVLPDAFAGSFGVVLVYRGAWCPFCGAQFADFAAHKGELEALGVKVVALSVDDKATSAEFAGKQGFPFPVGYGADADMVAALTGAFTNDSPHYLQPAAFTLTPDGKVLAAVYSTSAIGRLTAKDLIGFVTFVKSKLAAQTKAAEWPVAAR
jgi:peroxiredoxin